MDDDHSPLRFSGHRTAADLIPDDTLDARGQRLVLALTSGASLFLLLAQQAIVGGWEWFTPAPLRAVWFSLTLAVPLTLSLLLRHGPLVRPLLVALATAAVVLVLALTIGQAFDPTRHPDAGRIFAPYVGSLALAWFVAMPYLQALADPPGTRTRGGYSLLYHRAWDNLLTLLTAAAFTLLCWLILWLTAELFALLGLRFLESLLGEEAFQFPVTGLLVGFGLTLGRRHRGALHNLLRLCQSMARVLLPATAAVVVLFAVALLLGDRNLLWDTGRATTLLLSLILLMIALINGAEGPADPAVPDNHGERAASAPETPAPLRWLVQVGTIFLLPLAAFAAYAMGVRALEYGLTVPRLYGLLAVAMSVAYALGYVVCSVRGWRRPAGSQPGLGPVNRALGLVLVVALLLSQAPFINVRAMTLHNQLDRLHAAGASADPTDWAYLRFSLGRAGHAAVAAAARDAIEQGDDKRAAMLQSVLEAEAFYAVNSVPAEILERALISGALITAPAGATLPDDLRTQLTTLLSEFGRPLRDGPGLCPSATAPCLLLSADLDRQPPAEWIFVPPPGSGCHYPLLARQNTGWTTVGQMQPANGCLSDAAYARARAGDWTLARPAYDTLRLSEDAGTTESRGDADNPAAPHVLRWQP
ncbi:MAG: DUF4153 domain-containing protein [Oceanococcaceae bacterium]